MPHLWYYNIISISSFDESAHIMKRESINKINEMGAVVTVVLIHGWSKGSLPFVLLLILFLSYL